MFDWLKKLFGGDTPRTTKTVDLEAHLATTPPSATHGEAEYEAYDNGHWELEIEVDHPGLTFDAPLEVKIDGLSIGHIQPRAGGDSELKLHASRDTLAKVPVAGSSLEVFGADGLIVSGTFQTDH